MLTSMFINIGLLFCLLIGIREISKESKLYTRRGVLIVSALLIFNIYITYSYMQVKSSHNNATLENYQITISQIRRINYDSVNDIEDIRELKNILEDIYRHTNVLTLQMQNSDLVSRKDKDQFYSSVSDLSNILRKFILYHNSIFAEGNKIHPSKFSQYEQLKFELLSFLSDFNSGAYVSGTRFGIMQHKLYFSGNNIARLEKTVGRISEVINDLITE